MQKQYLGADYSEPESSPFDHRRPVASAPKHSTHSKRSAQGTRFNQDNLPDIDARKDRVCALAQHYLYI